MVIARASRPNKQRARKPSIYLAFTWHTSKLSSLILWNARVTVSQSWFCLDWIPPVWQYRGKRYNRNNFFKWAIYKTF